MVGFHDPFDIFREVFGQRGGGGRRFRRVLRRRWGGDGGSGGGRGSDLRYDLEITLEGEAAPRRGEGNFRSVASVSANIVADPVRSRVRRSRRVRRAAARPSHNLARILSM